MTSHHPDVKNHPLLDVLDNCVLRCSNYIHPWINVSYFEKLILFQECLDGDLKAKAKAKARTCGALPIN
jgi:hypothetical protein